jgi:sugar phosphate isomerase/epimerase
VKVGIAATMWRGLVDLPFPEFVQYCRDAGADVFELSGWPKSYSESLVLDDAGVEQVRTLTDSAGIEVVAVGCPSELVQPTDAGKAAQANLIKHLVDVAQSLDAAIVGLKAGNPLEGMSADEAQNLMVETLRPVADYAGKHGVTLALENGGTVSNDHNRLLGVVRAVNHPHVRALLDIGNFLRHGYSPKDVVKVCEEVTPLSAHIHFKDGSGQGREFRAVPIGEGQLDMERILRVIRDSGYTSPLCAQYEGPDQPAVFRRDVAWLRAHTADWDGAAGPSSGHPRQTVASA